MGSELEKYGSLPVGAAQMFQMVQDRGKIHVLIGIGSGGVQSHKGGNLLWIFRGPVQCLQKPHAVGRQHHWKRVLQCGQYPAVLLHHGVHIPGGLGQITESIAEFGGDQDGVPFSQGIGQRGVFQSGEEDIGAGQNHKCDRP